MNCTTYTTKELNEYVDGTFARHGEVQAHLDKCDSCAQTVRELIAVRQVVAAFSADTAPAGFRAGVMSRVQNASKPRLWVFMRGRRILAVAGVATILVAAVYFGLPSRKSAALDAPVVFAQIEDMHSQVQVAYAIPADSPTNPAPATSSKKRDDTDYLYQQDGM